jgi:MurNAc alpha-1-phosphate uridylyltransferase
MKAMILAAGRGERLRPLTDRIPKPMLTVRGRPLLEHQLQWLVRAGIREVVINLHHLGEQIRAHFGDGREFGVAIRYSLEPELLDTGGGIVKALPLLGPDPFLVLNGDIFTTFPFAAVEPLPDWADIHLVVTPKPAFRERGDFDVEEGRIVGRGDDYVYCGIAVLRPALFQGQDAVPFSVREHFFAAIEEGRISAQTWRGYWTDIGDQAQLEAVNSSTDTLHHDP